MSDKTVERTQSRYFKPDDFIHDYLVYELRKAEEAEKDGAATNARLGSLDANNDFHNSLKRFQEWHVKSTISRKKHLDDFLDGKFLPDLDLQLLARLATNPGSNIQPGKMFIQLDNGIQFIEFVREICSDWDVDMQLVVTGYSAEVTLTSYDTTIKRRRIWRRGYYDGQLGININPDSKENEIIVALKLALIAAYDHGFLWGNAE